MNKLYLLIFTRIFYPFKDIFEMRDELFNILGISLFLIFVYCFKLSVFKINFQKKAYTSIIDRIVDFFPIFSVILLFLSCILTLSYLKELYGEISLIISICYILISFFSYYLFRKNKFSSYIIVLLLEYFIVSLISFKFNEVSAKKEFLSLYISFACSLVSLKLLDYSLIQKFPKEFSLKFLKNKKISLYSIIFILLCFYPITLSILAFTFFYNRNLILAPTITFLYLICARKFQTAQQIKFLKLQRVLIFIFPLILLYLTSLFFQF